jgi:hypothetical protein
MIQKRHQPKKSTAWLRWLPDVGLDDPETTSTEEIHRMAVAKAALTKRSLEAETACECFGRYILFDLAENQNDINLPPCSSSFRG